MINAETRAQIRHLFYGEHWKIGTIAAELGLHRDTVRNALETDRFNQSKILRTSNTDPYISFIKETLSKYPRLRATRIHEMLHVRGYTGSVVTVRRVVSELRPTRREAFLRLRTFPGEHYVEPSVMVREGSVPAHGQHRRAYAAAPGFP